MKKGGGQPGQWGLPRALSFWVTGLLEFPSARRAAYLVTNCRWLPTQGARLSGYLPATFLPLSHCPLPGVPWSLGNRQTDTQGLAPAPTPPGAPQGAAGDSSPSELSYVSFLLRWGLGGESAAGGGEVGSATVLSLGLEGGGDQRPGGDMDGE